MAGYQGELAIQFFFFSSVLVASHILLAKSETNGVLPFARRS